VFDVALYTQIVSNSERTETKRVRVPVSAAGQSAWDVVDCFRGPLQRKYSDCDVSNGELQKGFSSIAELQDKQDEP